MSMSQPEDRKKRRQFLADMLFAGGGLAAAALLAKNYAPQPTVAQATPTPSATPSSCPTPEGPYPGEMMIEPQVGGKPVAQPQVPLGGEPLPPQTPGPHPEGDVVAPQAPQGR